jgi:hypothetical protein
MPAPTPTNNRIGISFLSTICPGTKVSLNLSIAPFLAVDGGFCLNGNRPTDVIPHGLTEKAMDDLRHAYDSGAIVIGGTPVYPPKIAGPIELAYQDLAACETLEAAKKVAFRLAAAFNRSLAKRTSARGAVMELLDYELQNGNRADIVEWLQKYVNKLEGISPVRESVEAHVELVTRQPPHDPLVAENPDV